MTYENMTDEQRFQRYIFLRDNFSFTLEQAAFDMACAPGVLRDIIARRAVRTGERMTTVDLLQSRKFSAKDKSRLRGADRHLAKGQRHHAALAGHHDTLGEHVRALHAAHRELTSTLKDLGERSARTTGTLAALGYDHQITRTLKTMGNTLDALTEVHGDADDAAGQARNCLNQAAASINGMIGGGSDEDDEVH